MALCPFATHKLIKPGANDPRIKARIAILHVAVSNASSLFAFFRDRSGGIESHFYITLTGKIEQYRDTAWQADANNDANDFAVSIETAGFGSGKWNAKQLAAIKRLLLWLHQAEGIPLARVDKWNGSGVGYHTQFGAPSHWTPVSKSCPGPNRIVQYNTILVPWLREQGKPAATPNRVEEGRAYAAKALALFDAVASDRAAVHAMATRIRAALAAGPKA